MKIKDGFFMSEVGTEFVVIAQSIDAKKTFDGMLRLNQTGAFLWKQLETEKSESQLVSALTEEYSVGESVAAADCADFLKTLREVNLLDE